RKDNCGRPPKGDEAEQDGGRNENLYGGSSLGIELRHVASWNRPSRGILQNLAQSDAWWPLQLPVSRTHVRCLFQLVSAFCVTRWWTRITRGSSSDQQF